MVFGRAPGDARSFLEAINKKTVINTDIPPEYAFSKLTSDNLEEIDVLVEVVVSEKLLSSVLPVDIRPRIKLEVIGSASSLLRQLAAVYQRGRKKNTLVVFDGDQKRLVKNNIKCGKSMFENNDGDFDSWFKDSISYIPGEK